MFKNEFKYFIAILFFFSIHSCDIEEIPPHDLVETNVITDQDTAEAALIGAYQPLEIINEAPFGSIYVSGGSHMVGFTTGSFGEFYDQLQENRFTRSVGWKECSMIINGANLVITKTPSVSDAQFSHGRKNEIIAEATFLRFFAQYYLLRHFGQFWDISSEYGALMRREPANITNVDMKQSTVSETYTLLLEDLDFVIANGADFSSVYRASNLLAKAFKAEVLLMRGTNTDLQNAIILAEDVLGNTSRTKETSYEAIFNNGFESSELLFTRFMDESLESYAQRHVDSMFKMFGGVISITPMLNDILDDDVRAPLYSEIIDETTIVPKIFKEDARCLPYYMRTSQMELVKAEAYARLGQKENAIEAINILRLRAGENELIPNAITDDAFIKIIFDEICKEMALEKGYEWYTAIRLKSANGAPLIFEIKPEISSVNQLIWPLPADETEFNILIKQNPGY